MPRPKDAGIPRDPFGVYLKNLNSTIQKKGGKGAERGHHSRAYRIFRVYFSRVVVGDARIFGAYLLRVSRRAYLLHVYGARVF